jgi:NifU-like protein
MATELVIGRDLAEAQQLTAAAIDTALGGLPADKRYCVELVAEAVHRALASAQRAQIV